MRTDNLLNFRGRWGLFFVSLALLMHEILLTRIFSVTMWYHFGFMVISLALLGLTAGAVVVFLAPRYFTVERAKHQLALTATIYSISIVLSFLINQSIPFITDTSLSLIIYFSIVFTFVIVAFPFFFVGMNISIALTKFPSQVSRLYAFNLSGSAFGCVLYIAVMRITDGPTAVVVVAALAAAGAAFFASEIKSRRLRTASLGCLFFLTLFAVGNTYLVWNQSSQLRLVWVLGQKEQRPLYEKWNPFSRVIVNGNPDTLNNPLIHGLSPKFKSEANVRQLMLVVDLAGAAMITSYDGPYEQLDYLKHTVSNLAHHVRADADVLIIGGGGGKDVLSALAFKQKSITAVEINDLVTEIMTESFADFAGNLHELPKVTWVTDEGRSYVARLKKTKDIIQLTFVDTFAASASGAFVLTENGLYTTEAWTSFMDKLSSNGVLTVTHYYFNKLPASIYRIVGMAREALLAQGAIDPRKHVFLAKCVDPYTSSWSKSGRDDVATIVVSKIPFTDDELDKLESICREMSFDVVLSPREAISPDFVTIIDGGPIETVAAEYPLILDPPTDDRPFFFHTLRFRGLLDRDVADHGLLSINMKAVRLLFLLLGIVCVLSLLLLVLPFLRFGRPLAPGSMSFLGFFMAIGLGFMFVEISQLNRLSIFLGHPTYSLAVVLFSLLVAGGLGSYSTHRLQGMVTYRQTYARLVLLIVVLVVIGVITPYITHVYAGATTPFRIAVALGLLLPMGFLMGMPFPMGMKFVSADLAPFTPWFWGVNGAMSVCASVLAVVIAMSLGISASFFMGVLCYVFASVALISGIHRLT